MIQALRFHRRCSARLTVDTLAGVPDRAVSRDKLVTMRKETSTSAFTRFTGLVKTASTVVSLASSGEYLLPGIVLTAHLQAQ